MKLNEQFVLSFELFLYDTMANEKFGFVAFRLIGIQT